MNIFDRMDVIARSRVEGMTKNHRHFLRDLLKWADVETGRLRPSLTTVAEWSERGESTVRAWVPRLVELGVLTRVRTVGNNVAEYRIEFDMLAATVPSPPAAGGQGVQQPEGSPPAARGKPSSSGTQTTKNSQRTTTTTDVGVVASHIGWTSERVSGQQHATPQLIAYLATEIKTKRRSAAWVVAGLTTPYQVPAPAEAEERAARKAEHDELAAVFDARPSDERARLLDRARAMIPQIHNRPDDDRTLRINAERLAREDQ